MGEEVAGGVDLVGAGDIVCQRVLNGEGEYDTWVCIEGGGCPCGRRERVSAFSVVQYRVGGSSVDSQGVCTHLQLFKVEAVHSYHQQGEVH